MDNPTLTKEQIEELRDGTVGQGDTIHTLLPDSVLSALCDLALQAEGEAVTPAMIESAYQAGVAFAKANPGEGLTHYYGNEFIRTILTAALSAHPIDAGGEATHRHKKRGTEYVLIGIGKMQAERWCADARLSSGKGGMPTVASHPVDMREVAVYRSVDDGELWVRPREEFEDGRFEVLAAAPPHGSRAG